MTSRRTASEERRDVAVRALAGLGSHRSDRQQVGIECRHSHHLAAVYLTDEGLVFRSRTGPHSHGSKDFVDSGQHGAKGGEEYVDLLAADLSASDDLPAWCDCGPRMLSRREVLGYVDAGRRMVRLP